MYNAESWIEATLDSVLRQTYSHERLELIVVDDGSTDDSVPLARAFMCEHGLAGEVLAQQQNAGVSAARNAGWRRASGDWLQFVDSDDLLAPTKLELQSRVVSQVPKSTAVVYSGWQHFGLEHGRWQPTGEVVEPFVDDDSVARILQDFFFGYIGPCLIRRSAVAAVEGFDERLHIGEDIDLMLRLAMAGNSFRVVPSPEPLFFYRITPGSLWRKVIASPDSMRDLVSVFRRAEMFLRQHQPGSLSAETREAVANRYGRCLDPLFEHDSYTFRVVVQWIGALGLPCPPEARRSIRLASRLLGYENALRLRSVYRRGAEAWV
jgi:glycosyltransferase involved in cell wall biosynthesis